MGYKYVFNILKIKQKRENLVLCKNGVRFDKEIKMYFRKNKI